MLASESKSKRQSSAGPTSKVTKFEVKPSTSSQDDSRETIIGDKVTGVQRSSSTGHIIKTFHLSDSLKEDRVVSSNLINDLA